MYDPFGRKQKQPDDQGVAGGLYGNDQPYSDTDLTDPNVTPSDNHWDMPDPDPAVSGDGFQNLTKSKTMPFDPFSASASRTLPMQGDSAVEKPAAGEKYYYDDHVDSNGTNLDQVAATADTGGGSAFDPFGKRPPRDDGGSGVQGGLNTYSNPSDEPTQKPSLPVWEQDEPLQTSGLNLVKNAGQGVQDFLGNIFKPQGDPNSFGNQVKSKAGQAISFFPSQVSSLFGVPAVLTDEKAREAYAANRKTLEGDEPGFFDFPAVSRGLSAAASTRASELKGIAENENTSLPERGLAAAGQAAYGALPNFAPAGLLPKGTISLVARGAEDAIPAVARGARALDSAIGKRVNPGAEMSPGNRQLYDAAYERRLNEGADKYAAEQAARDAANGSPRFDLPGEPGAGTTAADRSLYKFNNDERGSTTAGDASGYNIVKAALERAKGRTPTDAEVQQAVDASKAFGTTTTEAGGASTAAEGAVPDHLNPAVVGAEKASRNQQVHDLKIKLVDTASAIKRGEAQQTDLLPHVQALRDLGVKNTAMMAALKEAGLIDNGAKAASLTADVAPSAEANAALAASRGADTAAALKGTTTPATKAAVLRQKLTGATEGPVAMPPKQGLGARLATQDATVVAPKSRAQLVAEAKARLAAEGGVVSSKTGLTLADEMKAAPPVEPPVGKQGLTKTGTDLVMGRGTKAAGVPSQGVGAGLQARIAETPKPNPISLFDKDVSAEEFLRNRNNIDKGGLTPVAPPVAEKIPAPPAPVAKLPKTTVQAPVNTGSKVTANRPIAKPTGPAVGAIIPGKGKVVQQGSATSSAATKKLVTPPTPTPVTPLPTTAGAAAAPSVATAPAAPVTTAATVQAAAKKMNVPIRGVGSAGGTAATGTAKGAGRSRAPVTLNPTTAMYEFRNPNGLLIGQGATHGAAVKAAQQYLAANPPGGGGGGIKPPAPPAGGGPMKNGKPFSVPQKNSLISEVGNTARAAETTGDISYTLRQGFVLGSGHLNEARKAFGTQATYILNTLRRQGDRYAWEQMDKMQSDPAFAEITKLKPDLLTSWDQKLGPLEEGMLASHLYQLPILKQSNIAAVLFLNQLRFGVAKQIVKGAGSDAQKTAALDFIGAASGRANFPKWLDQHANTLSALGYSPRFLGSRIEMLAALPKAGVTRNPVLAKEAARDLVSSFIAGKMITGLAQLNGAKVEQDPTSPDWGKIQVGHTRVDMWGGYQPIFRLINQAYLGQRDYIGGGGTKIDRVTGMPTGGPEPSQFSQLLNKYRPDAAGKEFLTKSVYGKFLRSKLAPLPAMGVDWLVGQDYGGHPFDAGNEVARMVTPLGWQDIYEAIAEDKRTGGSGLQGAGAGAMSLLGAGVQTIPTDNTQYPMLSQVAVGAGARALGIGGDQGLNLQGTTPTPKPTSTPKATKAPGGKYDPFHK